jgi:hypothetical protein
LNAREVFILLINEFGISETKFITNGKYMADILPADGGGSGAVVASDGATSITAPGAATQTGLSTEDSIGTSTSKSSKKIPDSTSPELMQALLLLWATGGNNSFVLQQVSGKSAVDSTSPLSSASAASIVGKPVSADLFTLEMQNKMNEICINVLNAWGDQIKKENQQRKEEMNSESYQNWQAQQGKAGYEAWFNTLTSEQKQQTLEYPNFNQQNKIDAGMTAGLSDYMSKVKADPAFGQDLPFLTAAVAVGGALRTENASVPDTLSTSQVLIKPVTDMNDQIAINTMPNNAAQLGYLGGLFANGAAYFAFGQTLVKGVEGAKEIDFEFAKNYAQKILSVINGSQFNTIAMAFFISSADKGEGVGEERVQQLVKQLKVVLLSTSLALLYKTESGFKGGGGGITGLEFNAMVNGNDALLDSPLKQQLAAQIRTLRQQLPKADGDSLIGSITNYVDLAKNSDDLVDVGSLLSNIRFGSRPADIEA